MKKYFVLLTLVCLAVGVKAENFTKEQVLDIFQKYNPAILEKAKTDVLYETVLQDFADNYSAENTLENKAELIAIARNFENSLRLNLLTQVYAEKQQAAEMTGIDFSATKDLFRQDLFGIMQKVWSVTEQVHNFELDTYKEEYKQVKKDKSLDSATKKEKLASIKQKIKEEKANLKVLHKNVGAQIQNAVDAYVTDVDTALSK